MQIAHHLSELWKKQKGVLFMKHRVYDIDDIILYTVSKNAPTLKWYSSKL